jgi:cysteine desulfurase family protein (TIGR01976 family)
MPDRATPVASAPPPTLDNARVRAEFPALALQLWGQPVAFFDNPAGTQVPRRVIDAISGYLIEANANSHGDFLTSQRTDRVIGRARELMAAFLGAQSESEIAFGPNMTTLTYALSRAFGKLFNAGDEVIVSDLDHDANISPWLELAERGVVIRRIPLRRDEGSLDLEAFEGLLNARTRLVTVGYASNALGTVNDVARITRLAHAAGAWVWVDAVHYAPHGPIDVVALGVDFLVCSAYKFFGPHLGVLWGRSELLARLETSQVRPAPSNPPERFETGTKNHECLAGLSASIEYIAALGAAPGVSEARLAGPELRGALERGMHAIRHYELGLSRSLLEGLSSLRGLRLYGLSRLSDLERRAPTFAFTLQGIENREVSRRLGEQGIFTWAGHHYALTLMERLGLAERGGVVRVGAVHYNTEAEVQRLVDALGALAR